MGPPHPRRGQVGPGQRNPGHLRSHPRHRLVRAPAGRLQADPEHQGRRHRGGPGGNHRLLRHDPLRRYGQRDPHRQDHSGGAEHRPGVRRHQHRHAGAVPADRIRPQPDRLLRGRTAHRRRLEDLGKGLRSQIGTMYATKAQGPPLPGDGRGLRHPGGAEQGPGDRGLRVREPGQDDGRHQKGTDANEALAKAKGHYGQFEGAAEYIDPRTNEKRRN
jgi:hypothetical protein